MRKPRASGVGEVSAAPPGEHDAPFAFRLIEQHVSDQTMRSLFSKHARQEGDPHSGGDQFKDEVDLTAASSNLRRDSFVAAGGKDQFIEREAFLEQDEREPRQLFQSDGLPTSESVIARQEHHQRVGAHVLIIQILGYRMHQCGEVELAGTQALFQAFGVMHGQLYFHTRMTAPERGEHRSEHGAASDPRKPEAEGSALQTSQFVEFCDQILAPGEQADCMAINDFARSGELAAAADAIEQRHAELVLQLLHRLADRRLCRKDDFGSPGKPALPHHFDEEPKPAQVDVYSHMEWSIYV